MNNVEELRDGGQILAHLISKILIPFSDLAAALILRLQGKNSHVSRRSLAPARDHCNGSFIQYRRDVTPAGAYLFRAFDAIVIV